MCKVCTQINFNSRQILIGLCSLEFLKITLLWEEEEGRGSVRAAGSTGISNFQSNSGWEGEDEVFCPVVSMALLSLSI